MALGGIGTWLKGLVRRQSQDGQRLPILMLLNYSLPALVTSIVIVPVIAVLPTIYEKYYAVNFAALGIAMALSRGMDAVVDPVIAYLSDKTNTPIGSRKPWIIAGGILSVIGCYFLYMPQSKPGALYFLIWSSVVYFAWSMMTVPYDAWGAELSGDYEERARISTYKGMIGAIGSIAFLGAPIFLSAFFGFKSTEMTPEVMRIVGLSVIILLPFSLILLVLWVPQAKVVTTTNVGVVDTFRAVMFNRPYQVFLLVFGVQGLALGIYAALLLPFMSGYLLIPAKFSWLMIVTAGASFISTPAWLWACKVMGKHQAWAVGSALTNITIVGWLFVAPGPSSFVPSLIISALYGLFSTCAAVCYPAILGDINDYVILKTGSNRTGTHFAGVALLVKLTSAVGGGLALALVGFFGFSTEATVAPHGWAKFGILFTFIGLHTFLQLVAAAMILKFPLNRKKHDIIRKRLDQRAARQKRIEPATAGAAVAAPLTIAPDPA
ncbi:MAG TPA: MFS transporter [Rhizomicrobium sp.]